LSKDSTGAEGVPAEYAWETEKAPRVSNTRMVLTLGVFVAWLFVRTGMAARRWFGSLL